MATISERMYLDDRKIYRRYPHPERGIMLPGMPSKRVTVGMVWNLGKQDYVPDENVLVKPTVQLRRLRAGYWEVTVEKQFSRIAIQRLQDLFM